MHALPAEGTSADREIQRTLMELLNQARCPKRSCSSTQLDMHLKQAPGSALRVSGPEDVESPQMWV